MSLLHRIYRRCASRFESRFRILLYHRVEPYAPGENPLKLKVTPECFENHLLHYKKHNRIHFVDDLLRNRFAGRDARDMAITFDDGYADNHLHAFPLILKHKVPVTIFLSTDFVEHRDTLMWWDRLYELSRRDTWPDDIDYASANRQLKCLGVKERELLIAQRFGGNVGTWSEEFKARNRGLTWDEVREMQASGLVRFEAHGCSHTSLGHIPEEAARREILESRQIIQKYCSRLSRVFAYPYGSPSDLTESTPSLLGELGFDASLLAWGKENTRHSDPYHLDRVQRIEPY